jgi:hypothetical protein
MRQKMSQEVLAAKSGYERDFISSSSWERATLFTELLRHLRFAICGSLNVKPSVFLREAEKLLSLERTAYKA